MDLKEFYTAMHAKLAVNTPQMKENVSRTKTLISTQPLSLICATFCILRTHSVTPDINSTNPGYATEQVQRY